MTIDSPVRDLPARELGNLVPCSPIEMEMTMSRKKHQVSLRTSRGVQWTLDREETKVAIPNEGKALMAVGGTLLVAGAVVWLATGK